MRVPCRWLLAGLLGEAQTVMDEHDLPGSRVPALPALPKALPAEAD